MTINNKILIRISTIEIAKEFVDICNSFQSDIDIICGRYICDAKSILAVFSYNLADPVEVEIHSPDKEEIIRFNERMERFKL